MAFSLKYITLRDFFPQLTSVSTAATKKKKTKKTKKNGKPLGIITANLIPLIKSANEWI